MQQAVYLIAIILLSLSSQAAGHGETVRLVAAGLNAGNAEAVSAHFNTMIDLSLPGSEETYSKTQAGRVLKDFFARNPVKSFKITRQGSSADKSVYCIGTLVAGGVQYRVYFLLRKTDGKELIHQLQVQENQ